MRFLFPIVSLLVAAFSLITDFIELRPDSVLCTHGGCRSDQVLAGLDNSPDPQASIAALLEEDPADPAVWSTYAEFLSARGKTAKAAAAVDQALLLGPGISPILMRAANFDFTHDRRDRGLVLATRILLQTDAYDEILFSYLQSTDVSVPTLLESVIPRTPRVARSWLAWTLSHGTNQQLLNTWSWMRKNRLDDERSAIDLVSSFWERKDYRESQQLWLDWLGPKRGDYLHPQRVANPRFQEAPKAIPFDWKLNPLPSIELVRQDGLEVRFSGKENLTALGVRQFTTAEPGRYRLSIEIKADGLTTDEGPFFRISDPDNPSRLSVVTPPIKGSLARSWMNLDFTVPPGTQVLEFELLRRSSIRFDNAIAGNLHIYAVSLVPLPSGR